MLTARYSVVCVLLAALFAVVVLCVTDVCGEYSAGVSRGGDVNAHGPMHIYAAEKNRWQMRAVLQGGDTEKEAPPGKGQDSTQEKNLSEKKVSEGKLEKEGGPGPEGAGLLVGAGNKAGKTKGPDGGPAGAVVTKPEGAQAAGKVPQVDVKNPATDESTGGPKGGKGEGLEGKVKDQGESAPGPDAGAGSAGAAESPGGKGKGPEASPAPPVKDGEKAAGEGDAKSEKEVVPEQPKGQTAGGGASKADETTKKGGTTTTSLSKKETETETVDFAALVRAPLVFFSLLAALACVYVC